ncbi:DUF4340 domain-containing protein [Pseudoflavonifractor sp. 524-17]|uniref:DUF4340 domain-containing protein n=1 Tax=Pseudoflavonifractor sp. 524-17 TaxID=2304577 RepID=UPI00137AD88D|nr:DUF4340 domain-containing protein [Pseudoflavonifractor sp. 524-17]NCE66091.1 DUF4340 domain-containing protein [Pseudoflavonifractor sp. 524-17]
MSKAKKLYILLGIWVTFSTLTFMISRLEVQKEQIKMTGKVILDISNDTVTALSWKTDNQSLTFQKKDGAWYYTEDKNFPVNAEKIAELLEQFQEFGASFVIENATDYKQYGLDKPTCTIHITAGEKSHEIQLGAFSKMDSQRYVSIGDGCVYLVKHDPLKSFSQKLSDLIQHDQLPSFAEVKTIKFAGKENYRINFERDSKQTYCADDLYFADGKPLDTAAVKRYLNNISGLSLSDYASYYVSDLELKQFGLDQPELAVTVNFKKTDKKEGEHETFVIQIGRNQEELAAAKQSGKENAEDSVTAYIRVGNSQIVYRIAAKSYKALMAASYTELRHKEVLTASFEDIDRISISLEGNDYTFTSKGRGNDKAWYYKEDEKLNIDSFQSALSGLKAESFTSEGPTQKEEIGLTVYLNNAYHQEVSIRLYRYDGNNCLAVIDGTSSSLLPRSSVVDLIEAVNKIVLA